VRRTVLRDPGEEEFRRDAAARGLRISLRQADAEALPFADESFDYVLSWSVIFHGTMGDIGRRIAEIWRVLKPGGLELLSRPRKGCSSDDNTLRHSRLRDRMRLGRFQ
jgi:ubiquinone/menaquinone biosynthesis C-methylase UbiE